MCPNPQPRGRQTTVEHLADTTLQAEAELKGIREAGGDATLFQVAETLSEDVLQKMYAPPKPTDIATLNDPADLEAFDGILFGIPTRYGNFPAQFKTFWDKTGKQWQQGSFCKSS